MKFGVSEGKVWDIGFDEYLSLPALNFSTAKHIKRCPLAMTVVETHGTKTSEAMRQGTAVHTAVLQPDEFERAYAVGPKDTRRGSKAWREAEDKARPGVQLLRPNEYDEVLAMSKAISEDGDAEELMRFGWSETSITWTDKDTGLALKCRIDKCQMEDHDAMIVDLKTTTDASRWAMARRMVTSPYFYLLQLAYYARGFYAAFGTLPSAAIVAIEKTPGHPVGIYDIDQNDMDLAQDEVTDMLRMIVASRDNGLTREGYGRHTMLMPDWWYEQKEAVGI
jgi:hypothetical protein